MFLQRQGTGCPTLSALSVSELQYISDDKATPLFFLQISIELFSLRERAALHL